MSTEKYGWVGFSLPHRYCPGTYSTYSWESLPKIEIAERYKDITDLDKLSDFLHENSLSDDPIFHSVTSCYFEVNTVSYPAVFYLDQQGCVIWCLDEENRVVTSGGLIVSNSLPEFLTRISLENSIWFKTTELSPRKLGSYYSRTENRILTDEEKRYVKALEEQYSSDDE